MEFESNGEGVCIFFQIKGKLISEQSQCLPSLLEYQIPLDLKVLKNISSISEIPFNPQDRIYQYFHPERYMEKYFGYQMSGFGKTSFYLGNYSSLKR